MLIKPLIALCLGLVIQLSQVQLCWASAPAKSCASDTQVACCCGDTQSCPCASESTPDQKPAPLIPAGADLKPLLANVTEPDIFGIWVTPPENATVRTTQFSKLAGGYAGVPLSVAFCRFII